MENASKALLMAGGVLLSIIIIGVVMFAYRGITSLQKEKDVGLSNAQVSKINEQIEKYTSKSVIYGSEVLSICNAIEDYSKKYPESDGYPEIQLKIKIKADGKENDVSLCFKDEYNTMQSLQNDYNKAVEIRNQNGKKMISNGKTIEELYGFLRTNTDEIQRYIELYEITDDLSTISLLLVRYEMYMNCINTFKKKKFKAEITHSETTGIIESVLIQPK